MQSFSLKHLLAAVAFISFGLAAIVSGNEFWRLLSELFVFVGVAVGGVLAVFYGRRAAFAIGFSMALGAKALLGPYTNDIYRDMIFNEQYYQALPNGQSSAYHDRVDNQGRIADNVFAFGLAAMVGLYARRVATNAAIPEGAPRS